MIVACGLAWSASYMYCFLLIYGAFRFALRGDHMSARHKRCRLCPKLGECRFGCELLERWETSSPPAKRASFIYR
jgi:hypothetical protein